MKLALIAHKSEDGPAELFRNLEADLGNLNSVPNILCGPDYALAEHYCNFPNSSIERQKILKKIKRLSKQFPQTEMIIGTMPWVEKENMYLSGPLYKSGRMLKEFFKKRDNGESELASKVKTRFIPGNSNQNRLVVSKKGICYEICGDHGNQDVQGCDLELISALDTRGGFYISPVNDSWRHYGAIANGIDGSTACFLFNPNSSQRVVEIEPFEEKGKLKIYQID
jgi:hypothetical protein